MFRCFFVSLILTSYELNVTCEQQISKQNLDNCCNVLMIGYEKTYTAQSDLTLFSIFVTTDSQRKREK